MGSKTEMNNMLAVCWAASQGDLNELQRLVASGVDLNEGDYDGRTGLHLAASEGHVDAVQFFISKKANISPRDRFGGTPLADAVRGNHVKVIELLKNNNAKK